MRRRIRSYGEYWPLYLRAHQRPETRALHFIGTAFASLALGATLVSGETRLLMLVLAGLFGPAWYGHLFVERNRPDTFAHPVWALFSDYRMTLAWVSGRLDSELDKAGVPRC
ncbi:MAG: DUF962 domain-containing protein [Alphaproteobacteria bacterium]|nr:DUF962 domain-containing protein [Alphaproteobacteria bacterium]MDE2073689.1 DUF962 domain-containing protein [Alphaproteobacteria bacterium]MDE2351810.1 DUF962 domain-containing protein [Alphaproteobacteria bacterium]